MMILLHTFIYLLADFSELFYILSFVICMSLITWGAFIHKDSTYEEYMTLSENLNSRQKKYHRYSYFLWMLIMPNLTHIKF